MQKINRLAIAKAKLEGDHILFSTPSDRKLKYSKLHVNDDVLFNFSSNDYLALAKHPDVIVEKGFGVDHLRSEVFGIAPLFAGRELDQRKPADK